MIFLGFGTFLVWLLIKVGEGGGVLEKFDGWFIIEIEGNLVWDSDWL
jgi:hypothetical protein